MDTAEIKKTIASRRKERMTQAELGSAAGMSRELISRFETTDHDIGLRRLLRMCAALGLEIIVRPGRGRPTLEELDEIFKDDSL